MIKLIFIPEKREGYAHDYVIFPGIGFAERGEDDD